MLATLKKLYYKLTYTAGTCACTDIVLQPYSWVMKKIYGKKLPKVQNNFELFPYSRVYSRSIWKKITLQPLTAAINEKIFELFWKG